MGCNFKFWWQNQLNFANCQSHTHRQQGWYSHDSSLALALIRDKFDKDPARIEKLNYNSTFIITCIGLDI